MSEAWPFVAELLLNILGLSWMALAMDAHWRQVLRSDSLAPRGAVVLRSLGTSALVLSLYLCLRADHATMAALVWIMSLAAAALSVAFTLAWRPHWLAPLFFGRSLLRIQ
jgi:hypothetical protein